MAGVNEVGQRFSVLAQMQAELECREAGKPFEEDLGVGLTTDQDQIEAASVKRAKVGALPIKGDWIPLLFEKTRTDGSKSRSWHVVNRHTGNIYQCNSIKVIAQKFLQFVSFGYAFTLLHGTVNFLKLFVYVPYLLATGRQKEVWGRVRQACLLPLYQLKMLAIALTGVVLSVLVLPILFKPGLIDALREKMRQTVLDAKVDRAALIGFYTIPCYAPCMQLEHAKTVNNLWDNTKIVAIGTRNYFEETPDIIKRIDIQGQRPTPAHENSSAQGCIATTRSTVSNFGCIATMRSTVSNFFTGCFCQEEPGQLDFEPAELSSEAAVTDGRKKKR